MTESRRPSIHCERIAACPGTRIALLPPGQFEVRLVSAAVPIPHQYRAAVRAELDALIRGERPSLLTWVHAYGASGAVLVVQPDDIWTHPESQFGPRNDGTAWGVVPLWTAEESPSDLSAEFEVDAQGRVEIRDVHVL